MNTTNLMKDEFFAEIMWNIESAIYDTDKVAQKENIILTDSNAKSSLSKAKNIAKKGKLKSTPKNRKEEIIFDLAYKIDGLKTDIREAKDVNTVFEEASVLNISDWLLSLKGVEDSIKLRMISGGRSYLDFLEGFINDGRKKFL